MEKRTILTINEKSEILCFAQKNSKHTHEFLSKIFSKKFSKDISRRAIGDLLKKKIIKETDNKHIKRMFSPKEIRLDTALKLWIDVNISQNVNLSDFVIKSKALSFAKNLNVMDFKASNGWLEKFKKRYNLKSYKLVGETAHVDMDSIEEGRMRICKEIENYSLDDIYNMDETGLLFRAAPNSTISNRTMKGSKKEMVRITIMLCCNASGSDKRKLTVIGKNKQPRPFKNFNYKAFVDYFYNNKAWVTQKEFEEFIRLFDIAIKKEKRKIILLIDNAPGHKVIPTENIKLIFLPPNSTGILQPLDSGIIRSFKAHYRKYLLEKVMDMHENEVPVKQLFKKITIKEAIIFSKFAWDDVTTTTIQHCWNHTKLVNEKFEIKASGENEINNLDCLINDLKLDDATSGSEYLEIESSIPVHISLDDCEIVEFVNDQSEDCEINSSLSITHKEAKKAFETLSNYFYQSEECDSDYINLIRNISKKLDNLKCKPKQQTLVDWLIEK